jgi:hypothetical protein
VQRTDGKLCLLSLCSFTAFEARPLKTLTEDIRSMFGPSYYRKGTLYCSKWKGGVLSLQIGRIKESAEYREYSKQISPYVPSIINFDV